MKVKTIASNSSMTLESKIQSFLDEKHPEIVSVHFSSCEKEKQVNYSVVIFYSL